MRIVRAVLVCALLALAGGAQGAEGWKPERAVEIIALNAPGGGGDRILRLMVKVLQDQRYVSVPVNVINKPGGGGSVAYSYLNQHPGDGHYVLLASKSLLSNNLLGRGPHYSEFTPIVLLFHEWLSVSVKPDSPVRGGRELVERLRKDPAALSVGVATSLGNSNHQALAVALKSAGGDARKVRTVIFPSGGAATTAMLGGHIDVVPLSAAFAASMLRQQQVRVLAVTAPARLPEVLADVPTWREQGFDATLSNWRALVGPKGLGPQQVAFWENVMRRLLESPEWKAELERNFWSPELLATAEMRKLLERDQNEVKSFLVELGLAK